MIGPTRKINDFDHFINANQPPIFAPPALSNRTHSPRNLTANYQSNNPTYNNYANYLNTNSNFHSNIPPTSDKSPRNLSPNRITNTRKPMISPVRSPRHPLPLRNNPVSIPNGANNDRSCVNPNHPHKRAQFSIRIDDQQMLYCGVCAAQLASQGFSVCPLPAGNVSGVVGRKKRAVPFYPQYQGNKRYQQITEFLDGIISLEGQFKRLQQKRVEDHYQQQVRLLNSFYDELKGLVQKMRGDHLADLMVECEKSCQKEALSKENLEMFLAELNQYWEDLETNIEQVVEQVDTTNYNACMQTYRNHLQVFSHKLDEFGEETLNYTTYQPNSLRSKVALFQQQLVGLWEENMYTDTQKTQKIIQEKRPVKQVQPAATTIKNVHENLPKPVVHRNSEGEGPFRNLFPEDGEERLPQASPQFKNI